MFRKFDKIKRVRVPQYPEIRGKNYLSDKEAKALFGGNVIVTEKMDGACTGLIRTRDGIRLQKRGSLVDVSEHEQFNRFKAWSAEKSYDLLEIPRGMILYGELMFCIHTIAYDNLRDWFMAFALYDTGKSEYLTWRKLEEVCRAAKVETNPLLSIGSFRRAHIVEDMADDLKQSKCGSEPAEGVVVFNQRRQMFGKIVTPEFMRRFSDGTHWTRKPNRFNVVSRGRENGDKK